MDIIHERKSENNTGSHRPQELSYLHDNEGTKSTTSTIDARIKSIQLQNWIPTRKGGRKARRPHKKRRRPTHGRRSKTHSKCGNLTAQKSILGYSRKRRYLTRSNGDNRILRQGRRRDTKSKQRRRRDTRHQVKLGRRKKRNTRNTAGPMPMEGRPLMVSRKDLEYQGTKGYEPLLALKITNPHKRDMAERQQLPNSSKDDIIGQR